MMRVTGRTGSTWLGRSLIMFCLAGLENPGIAEEAQLFEDRVEVSVVEIDVQVVDSHGRPVTDLTIDDFEVYENRDRMTICNFEAIVDKPAGKVVQGPAVPQQGQENVSLVPVPREDRRLRLVIFVDNFNLRALDRKRVLKGVRSYIRNNFRAEDLAMVISYDRTLKVLQTFTNEARAINRALIDLEEIRVEGARNDKERRLLLERIDQTESGESSLSAIYPYAESVLHDVDLTIDALRETLTFLTGLPGRKALLYLSSGIPLIAAGDLFTAIEQKYAGMSAMSGMISFDSTRRFEELTRMANANDITFYPIDAAGMRVGDSKSAAEEGLEDVRIAHALDSNYQANRQDTLYQMADATGGLAVVNRNEFLPAMEEIDSTLRSYYSLAYVPNHHGDGRFYEVKVKVNRRGVRVRHRSGYRDKSTSTRMTELALGALRHDVTSNDLGIEVVVGEGSSRPNGQFMVPTEIRIPVKRLLLLPLEQQHLARIKVYVAAMDEEGDVSEVQEIPLSMTIPSTSFEAAQSEFWVYPHQLLMRSGAHRLVLGVYDELGSVSSFVTRSLSVGG